jgi:hypothetical protein
MRKVETVSNWVSYIKADPILGVRVPGACYRRERRVRATTTQRTCCVLPACGVSTA